jgi:hypothetical protein
MAAEIAVGTRVSWMPAGARLWRSGIVAQLDTDRGLAWVEHRQTTRDGRSILRTTPVSLSTLRPGSA